MTTSSTGCSGCIRGGRLAARAPVIAVVSLLALAAAPASAQITRPSNWAQQYAGTAYPNGAVNANYTIADGSNRILVVAVSATRTTAGTITCSASYGGVGLTPAAGDGSSAATWNHSFLFYLSDASIGAGAQTKSLNVTCSGGTSYYNWVYAAVYAGADQTTFVTSARNFNSTSVADSNVGPFNPTLTIGANDQAIEIVNLARATSGTTVRTISTWATGWTTAGVEPASIATSGPCATLYIRDRNLLTAANDGSQHTASSSNTWDSMTAMAIKVAPPGPPVEVAATLSATPSTATHVGSPVTVAESFTSSPAVNACQVTLNGGASWTAGVVSGAGPYTCTASGVASTDGTAVTIQMRASNDGGSTWSTVSQSLARTVDAVAPATTASAAGYVFGSWTATSPVSVTLAATDARSGVASTWPRYCVDTSNTCAPGIQYSAAFGVTCAAGTVCTQYVRFQAQDAVNNLEAVKSQQVMQDRAAPAAVSTLAATGSTQASATLAWTAPADSGSGASGYDVRYRVGNTFVEADWAAASQATGEPVPPATGMTVSGLSCGTTYAFALKTTDAAGNVSLISNAASILTGSCSVPQVTPGVPSATATSCTAATVSAPYTGDSNGSSTTAFRRGPSASGPWTDIFGCGAVGGPSPRTCSDASLSNATGYWFQVSFDDGDGVSGTNPQVVGPITTYDCRTSAGAVTASAATCNLVNVGAAFGANWDGDGSTAFERGPAAGGPWTAVAGCGAVAGASPRACADSGVSASSTYWYRATFADPDGVTGTNPAVSASSVATPVCGAALSGASPGQPAAASLPQASAQNPVMRLQLAASAGTVTVREIRVANLGTAAAGSDVQSVQLFDDVAGNGAIDPGDALVATCAWSATLGRYVASGLGYDVAAGAPRSIIVAANVAAGAGVGDTIQARVADADVLVNSPNTVSAFTVQGNVFTVGAGGGGSGTASDPMVVIVNPGDGAAITGSYRVQVHVHHEVGLAGAAVTLSTDGGQTFGTTLAQNSAYAPGPNQAVYEGTVAAPVPGAYSLKARAVIGGATGTSRSIVVTVTPASRSGDGSLLVRDRSSQLCGDCHALQTHSSATTSTTYGNWGLACADCHQPHSTRNVFLVKERIVTPNSGARDVTFWNAAGDASNSYVSGSGGSGPCQVCHTQTRNPDTLAARWRNTGNADDHYTSAAGTQPCAGCHSHKEGFRPGESSGGVDCNSCHANLFNPMHTTSNHHHYMNNAWSGDAAQSNTTTYPTPASLGGTADVNRRCLMCHVDHDVFRPDLNPASGGRGKNLRTGIGVPVDKAAGTGFTNSDYVAGTGGLCISCHATSQAKSYADPDGTTSTPAVTTAQYAGGSHDYAASSTFKTGLVNGFNANCSKCHGDVNPAVYQTSAALFQLHDSSLRSMTAPLGIVSPADPLEEKFCYRCHSASTDVNPGGGPAKSVTANDWYGAVTTMSAGSTGIYAAMQKGTAGSAGQTLPGSVLYFRATPTADEPMPNAYQLASGTYSGSTTFQSFLMTPGSAGSAQTSYANTTTSTTNPRYVRMMQFASPRLAAGATVAAGSAFTLVLTHAESVTTFDGQVRYALYRWTTADALGTTLLAGTNGGTELGNGVANTPFTQTINFTTTTAATFAVGDRFVLEVEVYRPSAVNGTATYYWNGAEQSRLVLPASLSFAISAVAASGRHDVGAYSGAHGPAENGAAIAASKHVECSDCHAPHAAKAGLHVKGSNLAGAVLTGAPMVTPTFNGTNWQVATAVTYAAGTVGAATPEAFVCFRCHSSYNTAIPNSPATAPSAPWDVGGGGFTNVALEFSTSNASYHPVLGALPATDPGANGSSRLNAAQLAGTDRTWTPGETMTCTDCHGADAVSPAAQGPHGSAIRYMLAGTNKAWPYTGRGPPRGRCAGSGAGTTASPGSTPPTASSAGTATPSRTAPARTRCTTRSWARRGSTSAAPTTTSPASRATSGCPTGARSAGSS